VLNGPDALLAAHDKLLTAERLAHAGLPGPRTDHIGPGAPLPAVPFPCVVKPRFGSWGQDVLLCRTPEDLARVLELIADRPGGSATERWSEFVGSSRRDARVVVAGTASSRAPSGSRARRVADERHPRRIGRPGRSPAGSR
jgi:glutathione synthase/RimK-type ligase-like ATP-grasp enzyme